MGNVFTTLAVLAVARGGSAVVMAQNQVYIHTYRYIDICIHVHIYMDRGNVFTTLAVARGGSAVVMAQNQVDIHKYMYMYIYMCVYRYRYRYRYIHMHIDCGQRLHHTRRRTRWECCGNGPEPDGYT